MDHWGLRYTGPRAHRYTGQYLGEVGDSNPPSVITKEHSASLTVPHHVPDCGILEQGTHMETLVCVCV